MEATSSTLNNSSDVRCCVVVVEGSDFGSDLQTRQKNNDVHYVMVAVVISEYGNDLQTHQGTMIFAVVLSPPPIANLEATFCASSAQVMNFRPIFWHPI